MNRDKNRTLWRVSLVVPILLILVGSITMYYYQFFLFSEKFSENGTYFLAAFIPTVLILLIIPYILFRKQISVKFVKYFLGSLEILLSIVGIVVIIGGIALSSLFIGIDHYNVGPMLTWGTGQDPAHEITVMWRTSNEEPSIVYYGYTPSDLSLRAEVSGNIEWHQVPLEGLTADTTYYYRVEGLSESNINSFITAPIVEKNFSFLVFSDTRQNTSPLNIILAPNVPKYMMDLMMTQGTRPAFTINCGDVTTYATLEASWKSWFRDISESGLASNAALQIAAGNHEREYNDTGEIFESIYPYTKDLGFSYAYNYSSLHVQVLDPWNHTIGGYFTEFTSEQLTWIENNLKNAQDMKYKILALHPPVVYNQQVVEMYSPLIDLCDTYGVDAVFFGHAHDFDVSKLNDTYYFLVGVGGNSFIGPSGFCQVDITSTEMAVNMHWLNGTEQPLATINASL